MNLLLCLGLLVTITSLAYVLLYGYSPGTRLKVFGVNENETGVALLIFLPGVLWLSCKDQGRFFSGGNVLAFLYLMCAILLTILSGSRGSMVSIGITILAFFLWRTTRKWTQICVVVLIVSMLVAPFLFRTSFERFGELSSQRPLGPREDLWSAAIDLIGDQPVVGVGIGNSIFSVQRYLTRFGYGPDADGTPIHNPLLVIWSETGIVGAGLYVGVLLAALLSFSHGFVSTGPAELSWLRSYRHIIASVFIGYIAAWFKGGGMETGASFFFMISLLLIPAAIARSSAQLGER